MDDKNFHEVEKIKISDSGMNKEEVSSDEVSQDVTIKGRDVIRITPQSKERIFNSIEGTAEEEGHFTWRAEEKQVNNHLFATVDNDPNKTQQRRMPKRSSRLNTTRRMSKSSKKYPAHFYIIFYGIPILVILILAILVVMRYQNLQSESTNGNVTREERTWVKAEKKFRQADIQRAYANDYFEKNDRLNATIFFRKALKLCEEAIRLGENVVETQISLEMQQQGFTRSQAMNYIENDRGFDYILRPIARWKKVKAKIIKKLEEVNE